MQSQHLLFSLLFLRGGEGWRWNKEEGARRRRRRRLGREQGTFLVIGQQLIGPSVTICRCMWYQSPQ